MKEIIARIYLIYDHFFPIARGKAWLGSLLSKILGAVTLRAKTGVFLKIFINSAQDKHLLYLKKTDFDETLKAVNLLKEGDVFVDIGSNIGLFSILASNFVETSGKVICFEPSYREYRRLLFNIEKNQCFNIVAFNAGISKESQIGEFAVAVGHTGLNKIASGIAVPHHVLSVPLFSLDTLWSELYGETVIDLVKIDVEGAEFWVLEGMHQLLLRKQILKLVIEITPKFLKKFHSSKSDIYNLLISYGYSPLNKSDDWQYDEVFTLNN